MTMLEQIKQDLDHLNEQQLQRVAVLVSELKEIKRSQQPKKRLSDFYRALPATRPYPGKEIMRESVAAYLAQKHNLTES